MKVITQLKEKKSDLSEVESDGLVNLYLGEVGHIPLLDAEQERELASIYRKGEKVRERLAQQENLEPDEQRHLEQEVHEGEEAKARAT